jgi:amidase
MSDDLWSWRAVDLAAALAGRQVSAREALSSTLERLDKVNPDINAVVDIFVDEAFAAADAADLAAKRGEPLGPLHGVPVTVKINVDYAGRATTTGVVAFKNDIAAADSPAVASLRASGAIIFGRTNVPAFCARFFTDNDLHGRTLNPFDPGLTPGGSSGGAAAAVACGIGALAHGTDRAGSIRYPAYACGVVGLRPSFGRVANYNANPNVEATLVSQLLSVQGPLARSVADVRLGLQGMVRRDPRDPWWVPAPWLDLEAPRPIRVAVFPGTPGAKIDPDVVSAITTAAHWLEQSGCHVEDATPPALAELAAFFFSFVKTEEGEGTSQAIERLGDAALRRARAGTMARATKYTLKEYVSALGRRTAILREWNAFLENFDVLLLPISYRLPLPIDTDQKGNDVVSQMIDAHEPMLAISMLGLPSLAVPTGLSGSSPTGVQIVSGRFKEELCLRVGSMIEQYRSPMVPIDPQMR